MVVVLLPVFWWGMMAVHELGHVVGAWATGGVVQHVELMPWRFSRTDVDPNPQPGVVVWCGPVVGVVLPLATWLVMRWCRAIVAGDNPQVHARGYRITERLLRGFAGFCLIANGGYIGAGSLLLAGDTYVMHLTGTPKWVMITFGLVCITLGLWLWHTLGSVRTGLTAEAKRHRENTSR